jgi:hypothetical protein
MSDGLVEPSQRSGPDFQRQLGHPDHRFPSTPPCGPCSQDFLLPLIALGMLAFGVNHISARQRETRKHRLRSRPRPRPICNEWLGPGSSKPPPRTSRSDPLAGDCRSGLVKVGQRVHSTDPLFELDTRQIQSQIAVQEARLASARAELAKQEQLPRPKTSRRLSAQREEAEAIVKQWEDEYDRQERLGTGRRPIHRWSPVARSWQLRGLSMSLA